jgi:hypothetical protein
MQVPPAAHRVPEDGARPAAGAGDRASLPAGFAAHARAIAILMAGYNLRRLNAYYQAFEGDLLLPIVLGEVALHAQDSDRGRIYRLSQLAPATGIARESTRRKVLRLVESGWLEPAGPAYVQASPRLFERFGLAYNRDVLDDFLWTASRMRYVLGLDASGPKSAVLRDELRQAVATRAEELPRPRFSTAFTAPSGFPPERLSRVFDEVAGTLNAYGLRHLKRLRDAFGGDLLYPLLLGEIGHYNVGALVYRSGTDLATLDALLTPPEPEERQALFRRLLRPCNAHSLGLATGIPDSTVRRKVAVLVARGWIAMLPDGTYLVTDTPREEFATLNLATMADFFATEVKLRERLAQAGEPLETAAA